MINPTLYSRYILFTDRGCNILVRRLQEKYKRFDLIIIIIISIEPGIG